MVSSEKWVVNYVEGRDCDNFQVCRGIYIERMRKRRKISIKVMCVPVQVPIVYFRYTLQKRACYSQRVRFPNIYLWIIKSFKSLLPYAVGYAVNLPSLTEQIHEMFKLGSLF